MSEYMNTGAPIHREDGSVVESGETFEPTDRELRTRAYKLEPVEWDLDMSPEDYLERHPDGPNAERAREALSE